MGTNSQAKSCALQVQVGHQEYRRRQHVEEHAVEHAGQGDWTGA